VYKDSTKRALIDELQNQMMEHCCIQTPWRTTLSRFTQQLSEGVIVRNLQFSFLSTETADAKADIIGVQYALNNASFVLNYAKQKLRIILFALAYKDLVCLITYSNKTTLIMIKYCVYIPLLPLDFFFVGH